MTAPPISTLPRPPLQLLHHGQPVFGRFAGTPPQLNWRGLQPAPAALWRRLRHKRWHYVGIAHPAAFIGVAIVDVGWTGTAFAYLFDRNAGSLRADWRQDGLPGLQAQVSDAPLHGALSRFRGLRARLTLQEVSGALQLSAHTPGLKVEATLDLSAMPPPLCAVGPIDGGVAHATVKTTALPVHGWAEAGGLRLSLDGAWAAVDASSGLLARETAWRWASAHGPGLGFNLQQGYFGTHENVLWLDGEPIPLGAAQFEFDAAEPLAPWRVRTDDGLVDLVFTPEGARAEDRNLGFAASHYVQPIGRFHGTVRANATAPARPVHDLLGVTEDHRSRW